MFSTFTLWLEHGSIFVRAVDIRVLRDIDDHCILVFEVTSGQLTEVLIHGTAQENLDRLKQEETEALIAAEKVRQRQSAGLPSMPVIRGRGR